jgi:RNA ligase (TIGR02306 family)
MAKDATIEIVENVRKHENADKLSVCNILGFQCVTKLDQFKNGDVVVYVRPDTVFPEAEWATEYRKYSIKRVKAVRLRNIWSEGVIIPFDALPQDIQDTLNSLKSSGDQIIGAEVSELLGITHYEPPQPQDLSAKGGLPLGIPKTDEERFENMKYLPYGKIVDVQLKIDGQSCSYYYDFDTKEFGVLGRSLEIKYKITDENGIESFGVNRYVENAVLYDIEKKMREYGEANQLSFVVRGESYGAGLQGHEWNPHAKMNKGWAMFSVFLIKEHEYANKGHRYYFKNVAQEMGLPIATMIEEDVELTEELVQKYSVGITELNGKPFEGVVIKTDEDTFKIINKSYDSNK